MKKIFIDTQASGGEYADEIVLLMPDNAVDEFLKINLRAGVIDILGSENLKDDEVYIRYSIFGRDKIVKPK